MINMKKFGAIIFLLLVGSLTLISCKKDYTCSCTVTWTGIIDTTWTFSGTLNGKKDDVKSECQQSNGVEDDGYGNTVTTDCQID